MVKHLAALIDVRVRKVISYSKAETFLRSCVMVFLAAVLCFLPSVETLCATVPQCVAMATVVVCDMITTNASYVCIYMIMKLLI